nr:unnamed protein product [Callosobruchus analis]
MNFIPI